MLTSPQSGFAAAALGVVIALILIGGGAYFLLSTPETAAPIANAPTVTNAPTSFPPATANPAAPATATNPVQFTGPVLAGTTAPLLDFNPADFAAAKASNKLIVIYFYANWCPECLEEFPKMQAAFNALTTAQVVGFRVNFNDNETDANEVALAREHGVAYQHTKVFVSGGRQILKSPETWATNRYHTEINKALGL